MEKVVIFGAGNIGRGFLAEILENKYELWFVDVDQTIIRSLNTQDSYRIWYQEQGRSIAPQTITNFHGLHNVKDQGHLKHIIGDAILILTAIGLANLASISPLLQEALRHNKKKKTIIACENAIRGTSILKSYINGDIQNVQFIDCIVDRIVVGSANDGLDVKCEAHKSVIIDQKQCLFPRIIPHLFRQEQNFSAFLERKIFLLNAPHTYIAWQGIENKAKYIHVALKDAAIRANTYNLAQELISILAKKHKLQKHDLKAYFAKVIKRFKNEATGDLCTRVGRGVLRKLARNDRFVKPLVDAKTWGLRTKYIQKAIHLGLTINNNDPEVDRREAIIKDHPNNYMEIITGLKNLK